jgi:hypothetical protein
MASPPSMPTAAAFSWPANDSMSMESGTRTLIIKSFFELLEERGPDGDWTPEDYMGPATPEWALWGNGGFDPRDDRVDRKGRKIEPVVQRDPPLDAEPAAF